MELKQKTIKIVMSASVANQVKTNSRLAQTVHNCIGRFRNYDYGSAKDEVANLDHDRAMGVYEAPCSEGKIWIKSDFYVDEGFLLWTVMLPSDY
jgi:hypothetical protein